MSLAVPFAPNGWQLTLVALIFAFAALGLFPTYFAMTQELSAAHQGKVTGTLGASAHMTLALVVYPIEGTVIQASRVYDFGFGAFSAYDRVLGLAGVFPLLALVLMLWLWPPWQREPRASA
jgi:ACS family hexuronate transporter-like MFS transporter